MAESESDSEVTTRLCFDEETQSWIQKLYEAWSNNAPVSTFDFIRDGLLSEREHLDTRISTLSSVARIACCDSGCGSDRESPRSSLRANTGWKELFHLAGQIELCGHGYGVGTGPGSSRKRKRGYNESNRLRNLALVAALWSPAIVVHYGWDTASQVQTNLLRACAVQYPRFAYDFRPRLNYILLERHRQAIQHGRAKTLNEAPLQPHRDFDLITLAAAAPDLDLQDHWVTSEDGHVAVDAVGTLLKDLRPSHFRMYLLRRDRYGLLVARGLVDECTPSSPQLEARVQAVVLPPLASKHTYDPIRYDPVGHEHPTTPDAALDTDPGHILSDFSPLPTVESSSSSSDVASAFLALSEDRIHVLSSDYNAAASGTTLTSATRESPFGSDLGAGVDGHVGWDDDVHGQGFGSPTLATGFDFGLECPGDLPELLIPDLDIPFDLNTGWSTDLDLSDHCGSSTLPSGFDFGRESAAEMAPSPLRHDRPQAAIACEGYPSHQIPISSNLARCSPHPAVGSPGPASSASSPQSLGLDGQDLLLASPPADIRNASTVSMEEELHTRYHNMITNYVRIALNEAERPGAGSGTQRKARAQWLTPATRWASVWTQPNGGLPRGRARSYDEADVLYLTSDEVLVAAQKGEIFRKPIVIKERFSDSGMHTVQQFASLLQDASRNAVVDVCSLDRDDGTPAVTATSFEALLDGLRINTECYEDEDGIALHLRNITRSHRPLVTMLPRFRLLDSLAERARGGRGHSGKQQTMTGSEQLVDNASFTSFNTIHLPGSFTGAHLDSLGGVWMRNLDGIKFCTLVPEGDMEDAEWAMFARMGRDWVPKGMQRFLVLEQDDVLLISPGLRVVYTVHSPTRGVMEGGIFWDRLNIVQILECMHWIRKSRLHVEVRDRDQTGAYRWLPRLIAELEVLVKQHPDQFRGNFSQSDDYMRVFEQAVSKSH